MNFKTLAVSASELGDVLGLTDRRIRQLAEEGILDRVERGKYPLAASVQAYIAASESDESDELRRERIALMKVQRRRIELDNSTKEATSHDLDYQDALIDTLTMHWNLQTRQIASWLYGEISIRDAVKHEAHVIAGSVEQWLVGLRYQLTTELKAAAATELAREI